MYGLHQFVPWKSVGSRLDLYKQEGWAPAVFKVWRAAATGNTVSSYLESYCEIIFNIYLTVQ